VVLTPRAVPSSPIDFADFAGRGEHFAEAFAAVVAAKC
jgi:hypothetical protein